MLRAGVYQRGIALGWWWTTMPHGGVLDSSRFGRQGTNVPGSGLRFATLHDLRRFNSRRTRESVVFFLTTDLFRAQSLGSKSRLGAGDSQ